MPVILEQLSNIGPQDRQDLLKIYQDYPDLEPDNLPHWIDEKLNSGQILFSGRFNDRIVGCIWALPLADSWLLDHLCTRTITRRRGVARQLLTLLVRRANEQHTGLIIPAAPQCAVIEALLQELGFTRATSPHNLARLSAPLITHIYKYEPDRAALP